MITMVEQVVRHLDKSIVPSPITGEYDTWSKEKERARKDMKRAHPNDKLKWNGKSWKLRQRQKEAIETTIQTINEIGIRTVGIGVSVANLKKHSSRLDSAIQKQKSLGAALQNATDEKDRLRIQGQLEIVDAEIVDGLKGMLWWNGMTTTAGTIGLERSLIKKLKQRRKR